MGILTLLTVLPVHHSCTEEIPKALDNTVLTVEPTSLILSKNEFRFTTYQKSSLTVSVISTNIDWEFTDIPDWISITPSSGTGSGTTIVGVTCEANPDVRDRVGVLVFRSRNDEWNYSMPVTVSQVRNVYDAIPQSDSINFEWTASQAVVKVNANTDEWTATAMPDLMSWCSVKKNRDEIELTCSENASIYARSGHISIETPDGSRTIKVVQSAIEAYVGIEESDSHELNFSDKSGTASLYINTFDKVHWTASSEDNWITLSPDNGYGSGLINVSVSENTEGPERTGTILVQAYDYQQEIKVHQNGKYLNVSSPSLSFNSKGGDIKISIKTNDGWKASINEDWIQLSDNEGNDDCDILLSVGDNNSAYSRTGTVTITPNTALPVVLNVEQAGRYLTLSDSGKIVFGHGGVAEKTITVSTDGEFDVTTGCEHLSISKYEGRFIVTMNTFDAVAPIVDTIIVSLINLAEGSVVRKIPIVVYGINREAVDLGLSVKWATCNVGALQSGERGDYYAWGELTPKKTYSWNNYFHCNGGFGKLTKYCSNNQYGYNGFSDGKSALDLEDDVAYVEWGRKWRIPSSEEFMELINECDWQWGDFYGAQGYMITSRKSGYTDRSIFLLAAGYYDGNYVDNNGTEGLYWTSSRDEYNNDCYAWYFQINQWGDNGSTLRYRNCGLMIRPVCMYDESELSGIQLNYKSLKLVTNSEYLLSVTAQKKDGSLFLFNGAEWHSDDSTVAVVSANGTVKAYGAGTCTLTVSYGSHKDQCSVTVIDPNEVTPDYVDLGLSVKWATFNVGACSPEMYGDYYAWGETEPYYMPGYAQSNNPVWSSTKYSNYGYSWESYRYAKGSSSSLTKYCYNAAYGNKGYADNKNVLDPEDDVAHVKWGGNWRIPSYSEYMELLNKCTWTWAILDGVKGCMITSNIEGYTDRSIFLPAAGRRSYNYFEEKDVMGFYYCSTLYDGNNPSYAYNMQFSSGGLWSSYYERFNGMSIRPVCDFASSELSKIELDNHELSLIQGGRFKLQVNGFKTGGGTMLLNNVEWSLSNDTVISIDNNGKIHALKDGTCVVTVTYGTHSDQCEVTVAGLSADMNDVMLTDNFYLLVNDYVDGEKKERVFPNPVKDPDDDDNLCVKVTTNQDPEHEYDAQLFIVFNGDFELYDNIEISFRRKAEKEQTSSTELHSLPGTWLSMNPIGSVQFTTEWTPFSYSFKIMNDDAGAVVIDLSKLQDGNVCYFDDISVTHVP